MTRQRRYTCAVVVALVAVPVTAASQRPSPATGQSFLTRPAPRQPDPFDALFLLPGQAPRRRPAPSRPARETLAQEMAERAIERQPVIKCGTTLVPMDADVDPKIYAPRGPGDTRHAIRGVTPEICK
jgi:hypothetical protein